MSQEPKKNNAILILYDEESRTCNIKTCFEPESTRNILREALNTFERDFK